MAARPFHTTSIPRDLNTAPHVGAIARMVTGLQSTTSFCAIEHQTHLASNMSSCSCLERPMAPLQCGLNTSLETPPLLSSWQKQACESDLGVTQPSGCVSQSLLVDGQSLGTLNPPVILLGPPGFQHPPASLASGASLTGVASQCAMPDMRLTPAPASCWALQAMPSSSILHH